MKNDKKLLSKLQAQKVLTPCVGVTVGDPNATYFEPVLEWLIELMELYQNYE